MPGPLPEFVESLLWCVAGVVMVWVCMPMLLMMLRQTQVTFAVLGGPESARPTGDDAQYADLFERLSDLGFEPLGSRSEIGWFCNGHWYKKFPPGRIFATPERDVFVSLFRIFPGHPWRLAFSTVFTDGALVMTANQMPNFRIDLPDYLRWGDPTPDLAELLRLHREAAEDFSRDRGRTVAAPDLEGVCQTICRHSERHLRHKGLEMGLNGLTTPLVFVGMIAFGAGYYFGFDRWTLPAAVALGGVAYSLLRPYAVRDAAQRQAAQDRETGLAHHWARRRQAAGRVPPERPRTPSGGVAAPPPRAWDDGRITRDPRP